MNSASSVRNRRPLLRNIRPYWLRQKLYYRAYSKRKLSADLFEACPLEFAPSVEMNLRVSDVGHRCIALTGFYELDTSQIAYKLAKEGGLLVDVGANYGYFSLIWAAQRPSNRVIAFECSPRNLHPLTENINRNHLANQIDVRPIAIGDSQAEMRFRLGPDQQTGWGGLVNAEEPNTVRVPVQPLPYALKLHPDAKIKLLKVDVEGADTWVLKGAADLLQMKRIEHILFEQYPARMNELGIAEGEAQDILKQYGYQLKQLSGDEWYAWLG